MRLRSALIAAAGVALLLQSAPAMAEADDVSWAITATVPQAPVAVGSPLTVHVTVTVDGTAQPVPGTAVAVIDEMSGDQLGHAVTGASGTATVTFPLTQAGPFEVDALDADGDQEATTEVAPTLLPKPTLSLHALTVTPYHAQYAKLGGMGTRDEDLTGVVQRRLVGATAWTTVDGVVNLDTKVPLWASSPGTYQFRIATAAQPDAHIAAAVSKTVQVRVAGKAVPWITYLNSLRAKSGATPVAWESQANHDAQLHARYMAVNRIICHCETPGRPDYSAKGDAVAQDSLLSIQSGVSSKTDIAKLGVEALSASPFHSIEMLSKQLDVVGMGTYRSHGYSAEDLYMVDDYAPWDVQYHGKRVQTFPGNGQVLSNYATTALPESPSPFSACKGYQPGRVGTPLWVTVGGPDYQGLDKRLLGYQPKVRSVSLTENGKKVPVCAFTASTYRSSSAYDRQVATELLSDDDAVVVMPSRPLKPGARYTATVVTQKETIHWSFSVAR
jgi:uncharacterized protein YkwD